MAGKIIGLVGLIGSGKGTVGDILMEEHGFIKESFAKSVKDAVSVIFDWDRSLLEGDTPESRVWREQPDPWWSVRLQKEGFTPRSALQLMGTESGRNVFHHDLWVNVLVKRISKNPEKNYVISDVRFPNEIDVIKQSGGVIYTIVRGSIPHWFQEAKEVNQRTNFDGSVQKLTTTDTHYSEWAWVGKTDSENIIYNNYDLSNLKTAIRILVNGSCGEND